MTVSYLNAIECHFQELIPSIPRTAKEKLLSSTARNGEKGLN